jgi:hypothetical protein
MTEASPTGDTVRHNHVLPLVALGLVLAAWLAFAAGRERVSRLDLSRWGTDLDIPERLAIDEYCARYFLPYIRTAVLLDVIALTALWWALARGRFRVLATAVMLVGLGSAAWHGLSWLVASFFAG